VLSKANRIVRAEDFKSVTRSGTRVASRNAVLYVGRRSAGLPDRYGFIVTKSVGSAVDRNLMRRRLRAITRELVESRALAADIVIRALPGSTDLSWNDLHQEILETIERGFAQQ
jgi:ribonuclease P protein component